MITLVVLVVYLTLLPARRLNNFGNFLKKVLGVLPISKTIEAYMNSRKRGEKENN